MDTSGKFSDWFFYIFYLCISSFSFFNLREENRLNMTEIYLTIFFISLLLFLLGSGIWVALSMIAVSAIGMLLFTTRPVGDAMATTIWGTSSSWTLTALPLFVWMGEILFRTKLSENLFKGLLPWLSKLPGGLVHVNVVGCALFAAISGSSAATVATVGKMSIPELRKRKYPEKLLLGTLAGSGTLGLLIPPSIILIIYGRNFTWDNACSDVHAICNFLVYFK